jgi:hypothetical protein
MQKSIRGRSVIGAEILRIVKNLLRNNSIFCNGVSVKLNQAVNLLKEIVERCPNLEGNNFLIMLPESASLLGTEGYEIIIRSKKRLNPETNDTLDEIVSRENLSIRQRPRSTMIYNPIHYTFLR